MQFDLSDSAIAEILPGYGHGQILADDDGDPAFLVGVHDGSIWWHDYHKSGLGKYTHSGEYMMTKFRLKEDLPRALQPFEIAYLDSEKKRIIVDVSESALLPFGLRQGDVVVKRRGTECIRGIVVGVDRENSALYVHFTDCIGAVPYALEQIVGTDGERAFLSVEQTIPKPVCPEDVPPPSWPSVVRYRVVSGELKEFNISQKEFACRGYGNIHHGDMFKDSADDVSIVVGVSLSDGKIFFHDCTMKGAGIYGADTERELFERLTLVEAAPPLGPYQMYLMLKTHERVAVDISDEGIRSQGFSFTHGKQASPGVNVLGVANGKLYVHTRNGKGCSVWKAGGGKAATLAPAFPASVDVTPGFARYLISQNPGDDPVPMLLDTRDDVLQGINPKWNHGALYKSSNGQRWMLCGCAEERLWFHRPGAEGAAPITDESVLSSMEVESMPPSVRSPPEDFMFGMRRSQDVVMYDISDAACLRFGYRHGDIVVVRLKKFAMVMGTNEHQLHFHIFGDCGGSIWGDVRTESGFASKGVVRWDGNPIHRSEDGDAEGSSGSDEDMREKLKKAAQCPTA